MSADDAQVMNWLEWLHMSLLDRWVAHVDMPIEWYSGIQDVEADNNTQWKVSAYCPQCMNKSYRTAVM